MNRRRLLNIPINRKEIASLKEDNFVWLSFLITIVLAVLIIVLIFITWNRLPPQVPLFYSRPWGETQLSPTWGLWLLAIFSFTILGFNLILSLLYFQKNVLIRKILAATSLLFSLLSIITVIKIISLIT